MSQTIDLRAVSGGEEYTWPVTITEQSVPPVDISADTVEVSFGTSDAPGDWFAPDVDEPGADAAGIAAEVQNQRTVKVLIGGALILPAGSYVLWTRITDVPEVVPRKHQTIKILADAAP